jgi:hypothetical protein
MVLILISIFSILLNWKVSDVGSANVMLYRKKITQKVVKEKML